MTIPILLLGSFALILKGIPSGSYQRVLRTAFSGAFLEMLDIIYEATYGLLSVYMTFSISFFYLRSKDLNRNYTFIGGLTATASFFILSGINAEQVNIEPLGVKGMFIAIFCGIFASYIYCYILKKVKIPFKLYSDGVDMEFNDSIIATVSFVSVVTLAAIFNYLVSSVFGAVSFHEVYVRGMSYIFNHQEANFTGGFVYVVASSILWFLGIHGTNVLENVSDKIFSEGMVENIVHHSNGEVAGNILTEGFFRHFVLIGGCGTSLCLLFAIILFGKRKNNRNLSAISGVPMLFNINEIMLFGLPVIYNPYLLAPFLVTPVMAYCISFLAMYFNIVPVTVCEVPWTTPVFISGYQATDSVMGAVLQLVILLVGIFIYMPFVKLYDTSKIKGEVRRMTELTEILKKAEENREEIMLLELPGVPGTLAKLLASDIKSAIENEDIRLYYQLQYNNDFECIGAETLLRYNHPTHGFIYPPLIVKIAEEAGILSKLEKYLFTEAAIDYGIIRQVTGKSYKISVNITVATLMEEDFIDFLTNLKKEYEIGINEICIEVTEQMAIKSDSKFEYVLGEIKNLGFMIAIDDFSMGSTSIKYLQKNQFDIVKLDGSIVREMMKNERSRDIISSIVYLSQSLDFKVLAEYVETKEQWDELKKIGCAYYQGYYFSKSVTLNEFIENLLK